MNNAFKQNKILVLSENYLIKPDNSNGVILVFTEQRPKVRAKGEVSFSLVPEYVTHKEEWQYPRIAQALRKYADLEIMVEDNIEAMITVAERVYKLIDRIDATFKQF